MATATLNPDAPTERVIQMNGTPKSLAEYEESLDADLTALRTVREERQRQEKESLLNRLLQWFPISLP